MYNKLKPQSELYFHNRFLLLQNGNKGKNHNDNRKMPKKSTPKIYVNSREDHIPKK